MISYNTADDASNGEFFESGSVHTVVIEAADQNGGIQSLTREVVTPSYSTVAAANKAEGVSTADSNGGFRVFAYGTEANNPNRIFWSEEALLGMHGDNLADLFLGPDIDRDGLGDFVNSEASNGFIDSTVINYDRFGVNVGNFQDPDFIDPILTDGTLPGFPGIQSRDAGTGNAILEITTYIEFLSEVSTPWVLTRTTVSKRASLLATATFGARCLAILTAAVARRTRSSDSWLKKGYLSFPCSLVQRWWWRKH